MKILLLVTAFNGFTQRVHTELRGLGHEVSVELALNEKAMFEAVDMFKPDLILCPFLKQRIPREIWTETLCLILHPGIRGDKGPSSLDWAITNQEEEWGVVLIEAEDEFDAGAVWGYAEFKMRDARKASIYRHEITECGTHLILETVLNIENGIRTPEVIDEDDSEVRGVGRPVMKQTHRKIEWDTDTTEDVIRKIHAADSFPGVLDEINDIEYFLYNPHKEGKLRGTPGQVLCHRDGAICIATTDAAVWVSHLRQRGKPYFKVPATKALGEEYVDTIPENKLPLLYSGDDETFKEIWYKEVNEIGYLGFNFYNGAMSTEQCMRLNKAFLAAKECDTKVIVLEGGVDFFSNGIHLNTIEFSDNPARESWRNINAMNDLIFSILTNEKQLTIADVWGSAGAGGVILALACDKVFARSGVILNPHYKTMGLYGSEFWTYLLPKRLGQKRSEELTESCYPISAHQAKTMGLIDEVIPGNIFQYHGITKMMIEEIAHSSELKHIMMRKRSRLVGGKAEVLKKHREEELEEMLENFFGDNNQYNDARYNFVYKVCPTETPAHLAVHRQQAAAEAAAAAAAKEAKEEAVAE